MAEFRAIKFFLVFTILAVHSQEYVPCYYWCFAECLQLSSATILRKPYCCGESLQIHHKKCEELGDDLLTYPFEKICPPENSTRECFKLGSERSFVSCKNDEDCTSEHKCCMDFCLGKMICKPSADLIELNRL